MKQQQFVLSSTLVLLSLGLSAAVQCGDFIVKNTVLDSDLVCDCDVDPFGTVFLSGIGLIVVGPAVLDMAGHSVSCSAPGFNVCISPAQSDATIKNGVVSNCSLGVAGERWFSDVLIRNVTATSTEVGFYIVGSNNNRIINVTAIGGQGITVRGDNNIIKDSYMAEQFFTSLAVRGDNNSIIGNTVENNLYQDGFALGVVSLIGKFTDIFSKNNVVENNVVKNSSGGAIIILANNTVIRGNRVSDVRGDPGFAVGYSGNRVIDNHISDVAGDGILGIAGGPITLVGNTIKNAIANGINVGSLAEDFLVKENDIQNCSTHGIYVRSSGHSIIVNDVEECYVGIRVSINAANTLLRGNEVEDSTTFDLSDDTADCGTNRWISNEGNGNQACTEERRSPSRSRSKHRKKGN